MEKNALKITDGGSMRPKYVDHFVDIDDAERLYDLLKRANHAGWKARLEKKNTKTLRTNDEN